jgi:hypothetical protein
MNMLIVLPFVYPQEILFVGNACKGRYASKHLSKPSLMVPASCL